MKILYDWVVKEGPASIAYYAHGDSHDSSWFFILTANIEDAIDHIQEALKLIEKHARIEDKAKLTETFIHG